MEAILTTLSEMIQHDKPISTGAFAVYPYSVKLERQMRFTSRFGEEVPLCRADLDAKRLFLPRALCPVGVSDERVVGDPVKFPADPVPRDYQEQLFKETEEFLAAGQSGVVSAFTGYGKTIIGYHAAYVVGRKTLVVTTKDDIYKQWIEGAKKFLQLPAARIGEIRGDKCEVQGTDFCVAMIHSLSKDGKYPEWITKGFGLIIYDEVHRLPAEQFSVVADMFPALLRLGLSATPYRADGKELLIQAHIGPLRAKTEAQLMVPKVLRFHSAWQCPRRLMINAATNEREVARIPHEPGKTTHIEKMIAADNVRNHMLARLIKQAADKGRKVVVFSTLIEHLKAIHRACLKSEAMSGRQMGFYVGATTKADKALRERAKVKDVVFATYGMMSEGTDIPWLDTCLLAMPRSAVTQPIGRIRREYPDKAEPVVMDVIDNDSPVFQGYANARLKWYKSISASM